MTKTVRVSFVVLNRNNLIDDMGYRDKLNEVVEKLVVIAGKLAVVGQVYSIVFHFTVKRHAKCKAIRKVS